MDIRKLLREDELQMIAEEKDIQLIVQNAKKAFWENERRQLLSCREFLWNQFHMMRKRWWVIQFFALAFAWLLLSTEHELFYVRREMGLFAALFVIFLIPEMWRNISNRCMEIEIASYYSLQQIYAARLLLFGVVDVLLLTAFICGAHYHLNIALADLITQFLLPMIVTACICFVTLSSQRRSGWIAVGLCILWSGVWWTIVANDPFYAAITVPIWMAVFFSALLLLAAVIHRFLKNSDKYMEVNPDGIVFE